MIEAPFTLPCGVEIKNRLGKAAMSEALADKFGSATNYHNNLYHRWSQGGAGLVISGNVMIDRRYLGEFGNVIVEKSSDHFQALKKWAAMGTQNRTALWAQINHPGKQSPRFLCSEPVAPSAIPLKSPLDKMFLKPRALLEEEIYDIIDRFVYAADQLKKSGFSGVQIHGAHGYLVSQFLSSHHNQRQDQWGGDIENRARFLKEIIKKMRSAVGPKFPIGVKLNSSDFQKGGFSEEESRDVVKEISRLGVDLIEVSGGNYEKPMMVGSVRESTKKREAYFIDYCRKLKSWSTAPIMLTGGFRSRAAMETALEEEVCQFIGLARSLALDPDFPNKLITNQGVVESLVTPLSSGINYLDRTFPLEITWYTQQIHRMARGQNPDLKASVKWAIMKSLLSIGGHSLRRVRSL